jgi:hypothetical protein
MVLKKMSLNPAIVQIDGWTTGEELKWLYETAQKVPEGGLIVEIGVWKGRSSAALYDGAGTEKTVVSIDTWKGQDDFLDTIYVELKTKDIFGLYLTNMRTVGFVPQPYQSCQAGKFDTAAPPTGAQYLISDSVAASTYFVEQSIDFLFIDGDHRKCGEDIDAFLPKMKPDGLISGHDYFGIFEKEVQQEIHKRFYIHQVIRWTWVHHINNRKPGWY